MFWDRLGHAAVIYYGVAGIFCGSYKRISTSNSTVVVNRKLAGQMSLAATVHAATVA